MSCNEVSSVKKSLNRIAILLLVLLLLGCGNTTETNDRVESLDSPAATHALGQIYLYGERHGANSCLIMELRYWKQHYDEGMRDLFVELPYYSAQFLNLWMLEDDDEILDALFEDWEGTAAHSQRVYDCYKQLKQDCPETVFHGIDVGHGYASTGERYLQYLSEHGYSEDSEEYHLTLRSIDQGKEWAQERNHAWRENTMAENFILEYERLNGADVMGIFGAAHTEIGALNVTGETPSFASQLYQQFGDAVHSQDLIAR